MEITVNLEYKGQNHRMIVRDANEKDAKRACRFLIIMARKLIDQATWDSVQDIVRNN